MLPRFLECDRETKKPVVLVGKQPVGLLEYVDDMAKRSLPAFLWWFTRVQRSGIDLMNGRCGDVF